MINEYCKVTIMQKVVFCLHFVLLFVLCGVHSSAQSLPLSLIQGRWSYVGNNDDYVDYLPSGEMVEVMKKNGVSYLNTEIGNVSYRLEEKNDTLYLIHCYKQKLVNNENILGFEVRLAIRISGDYLESFNFKGKEGITKHIGCYGLQVRHLQGKPYSCNVGMPKTIFILPINFRGHVTIAYSQPDGVVPEYDSLGNRIVRIPLSGLLKTRIKEDAFGTAGGRYCVMVTDTSDGSLHSLPAFDYLDNLEKHADPNQLVVFMVGFNRLPRKHLDRLFGEPIGGNIMMFYVDDFKKANNPDIGCPWF